MERGDAKDIDGQTERSNGASGKSDIEGKAMTGSRRASRRCGGQVELADALLRIASGMCNVIEKRDGEYWVPNPINPQEDFADKWKEQPEKAKCFSSGYRRSKTVVNNR
jgi:hypothetical protein